MVSLAHEMLLFACRTARELIIDMMCPTNRRRLASTMSCLGRSQKMCHALRSVLPETGRLRPPSLMAMARRSPRTLGSRDAGKNGNASAKHASSRRRETTRTTGLIGHRTLEPVTMLVTVEVLVAMEEEAVAAAALRPTGRSSSTSPGRRSAEAEAEVAAAARGEGSGNDHTTTYLSRLRRRTHSRFAARRESIVTARHLRRTATMIATTVMLVSATITATIRSASLNEDHGIVEGTGSEGAVYIYCMFLIFPEDHNYAVVIAIV